MGEERKIRVDQDVCIGCGSCVAIAPKHFKINDDGKSEVIVEFREADEDIIKEAITSCPVQAISLK